MINGLESLNYIQRITLAESLLTKGKYNRGLTHNQLIELNFMVDTIINLMVLENEEAQKIIKEMEDREYELIVIQKDGLVFRRLIDDKDLTFIECEIIGKEQS